jgi:hypothetical protein
MKIENAEARWQRTIAGSHYFDATSARESSHYFDATSARESCRRESRKSSQARNFKFRAGNRLQI